MDRVRSGAPRKLGLEDRQGADAAAAAPLPSGQAQSLTRHHQPSPEGPGPGHLFTHFAPHPALQASVPTPPRPTRFSVLNALALWQSAGHRIQRTAVRWTSLRQAASEVTSTLTAAAHPRPSSKRPRHHAAQETATLQPAPGKPDGGTQRTVPRTLGTLPPPALRPARLARAHTGGDPPHRTAGGAARALLRGAHPKGRAG